MLDWGKEVEGGEMGGTWERRVNREEGEDRAKEEKGERESEE